MMTVTVEQTRTYTGELQDVLQILFGVCKGRVQAEARSHAGFGQQSLTSHLPFTDGVPLPVLEHLADRWQIRASPVTDAGHLGALAVVWKPRLVFDRKTGQVPAEAEVARIREARENFPLRPSAFIDATSEVAALYALTAAVPADAQALDLALRLCARLGAPAPEDLHATIPVAGICRNVGTNRGAGPPWIMFDGIDTTRRYTIVEITRALRADKETP